MEFTEGTVWDIVAAALFAVILVVFIWRFLRWRRKERELGLLPSDWQPTERE